MMRFKVALIASIIASGLSAKTSAPEGFMDFFEPKEAMVSFSVAGNKKTISVQALIDFDRFVLTNNVGNIEKLNYYLKESMINDDAVGMIIENLLKGVSFKEQCDDDFLNCIPKEAKKWFDFQYLYEERKVKTFITSDLIDGKQFNHGFHSAKRTNNALVNNSEIYAYASNNDSSLVFNNNTLLGLPYGFIDLETQYRSSDNEFDIDRALYDLEVENYRLLAGYQSYNRKDFNSTDILDNGFSFSGSSITFGTSRNLIIGGKENQQKLYFFAPYDGQLEIYREGKLILTNSISQGQQSILYADLPSGVYDAEIIIKKGGKEQHKEIIKVVNNRQFNLPVKSFDYKLEAGYLELDDSTYDGVVNDSARYYAKAAVSYRPTETFMFASSVLGNEDSFGFQAGYNWSPLNRLSIQQQSTIFNQENNQHSIRLSFSPFSFSARKVNSSYEYGGLGSLLYNNESFLEWGASSSLPIVGASGFVSFSRTEYTDDWTTSSDRNTLSLSFSKNIFGGSFSSGVFYTNYDDEESNDNWSVNLNFSKTFGALTTRLSALSNQDDKYAYQADLAYKKDTGNHSTTSTISAKYSDLHNAGAEVSVGGVGNFDFARYSYFAYANTDKDLSISANLNSTQVVSSHGLNLVSESGDAFFTVNPAHDQESKSNLSINYDLTMNDQAWKSGSVFVNKDLTSRLLPFNTYEMSVDGERDNIEVDYNVIRSFIAPASHIQVQPKITPLDSQVFLLSDIDGNALKQISCIGDNCRGTEELSDDGVFRIKYLKGGNFKLSSGDYHCDFDRGLLGSSFINATCSLDGVNSQVYDDMYLSVPNVITINKRVTSIWDKIKENIAKGVNPYDLDEIQKVEEPLKRVLKLTKEEIEEKKRKNNENAKKESCYRIYDDECQCFSEHRCG